MILGRDLDQLIDRNSLHQIEILREAHDALEARRNLDQLDSLASALGRYKGMDREFSQYRSQLISQAFRQTSSAKDDDPLRAIKRRAKKKT